MVNSLGCVDFKSLSLSLSLWPCTMNLSFIVSHQF